MKNKEVEFETYHSNKKRIYFFCVFVCVVVLLVVFVVTRSHAKYKTTQSIPLVNGTINYELSDLNLIGVYIQGDDGYTKSDTIPESGYVLNEEESYCTINGEKDSSISISYDTDTQTLNVSPMTTKGTKCTLYFDEEKALLNETVLANATSKLTRSSFTSTVSNTTTGTIYYADTSKGRTYYFAGNPTDNWVKFAGFYWRIIRINEDGTIRLIYQGTSANTTGSGTQLSNTSAFNSSYNNNMYVGYMYQNNQVHGLTSSSTIKGVLDQWYQNNLTSVADKIDGNAGFCGDREPSTSKSTSNGSGGTGTTITYYGAYIRLYGNNKVPTFECQNSSDLYTTSGSEYGNKALTYPIGLITADEIAYAGGVWDTINRDFYLYTDNMYWSITPHDYTEAYKANMFAIDSSGCLYYGFGVNDTHGVRPVINLKADMQINSGNGTASQPYIVN